MLNIADFDFPKWDVEARGMRTAIAIEERRTQTKRMTSLSRIAN